MKIEMTIDQIRTAAMSVTLERIDTDPVKNPKKWSELDDCATLLWSMYNTARDL